MNLKTTILYVCKNEEILEGFQKATLFLSGMTFTSNSISEISKIKNINIFSEKKNVESESHWGSCQI